MTWPDQRVASKRQLYKYELAKAHRRLTAKQKSRPKVAKWKTKYLEVKGSFYLYNTLPASMRDLRHWDWSPVFFSEISKVNQISHVSYQIPKISKYHM